MKRYLLSMLLMAFVSSLAFGQQSRLQIISLNKDARTFVKAGNDWKLADINTEVDASTIFKNYSDPPSRVVVRDWQRNVQYDITISQREFSLADALNAEVSGKDGKMLPFIVKAIGEARIPAIHYSRSSAALSQRGTEQQEANRQAQAVVNALIGEDGVFHIDRPAGTYSIGLIKDGEELILTNYSEGSTLYMSVYRITARSNGKLKVEPVFGNNSYLLPPLTETRAKGSGEKLLLIATEEEISPSALAVTLERSEGKSADGEAVISAGAIVLD